VLGFYCCAKLLIFNNISTACSKAVDVVTFILKKNCKRMIFFHFLILWLFLIIKRPVFPFIRENLNQKRNECKDPVG
jgi:hypothetical protein